MKKIISLILSMTMLTSAVSCSERKESATSDREILNYIPLYTSADIKKHAQKMSAVDVARLCAVTV